MDNFFTSIPLAKTLFQNEIGLIGTLRSNKNEVPEEFLASKENPVLSSKFAFDKFMTLCAYFPKVTFKDFLFLFKRLLRINFVFCKA